MTPAAASAHPDKQPGHDNVSPLSCDQYSVLFHRHRARALLRKAYAPANWATGPDRSEVAAYRRHRACIRIANVRRQLAGYRRHLADRLAQVAAVRQVTPYPGPNGTWWAIPWQIVACESGGNWNAANPSGAVGPYQLLGWGAPYPVTSQADKLAHHRIAARVWAGGAGRSNWVC